jgi:hypothetical protein
MPIHKQKLLKVLHVSRACSWKQSRDRVQLNQRCRNHAVILTKQSDTRCEHVTDTWRICVSSVDWWKEAASWKSLSGPQKFQRLTIPCVSFLYNNRSWHWSGGDMYHDNSRITSGILCQDFSKCLTIVAQPLGPLYQVTRGKHIIGDHISHI